MGDYAYGYSKRESQQFYDQAGAVSKLLHHDTIYPSGSEVLGAGCDVGSQTVILAKYTTAYTFNLYILTSSLK